MTTTLHEALAFVAQKVSRVTVCACCRDKSKSEDFGFDPKTHRHDARLTYAEDKFVEILWTDHTGFDNRVSADDLAREFAVKIIDQPNLSTSIVWPQSATSVRPDGNHGDWSRTSGQRHP